MADVLIKGIEIPDSCEVCPLFDGSWCNAQPMENWRTSYFHPFKGERQESCPLVPVPEHGDLVDITPIRDKASWVMNRYDTDDWGCRLADLIENAPTVLERTT